MKKIHKIQKIDLACQSHLLVYLSLLEYLLINYGTFREGQGRLLFQMCHLGSEMPHYFKQNIYFPKRFTNNSTNIAKSSLTLRLDQNKVKGLIFMLVYMIRVLYFILTEVIIYVTYHSKGLCHSRVGLKLMFYFHYIYFIFF